jgi:hypothetical protein
MPLIAGVIRQKYVPTFNFRITMILRLLLLSFLLGMGMFGNSLIAQQPASDTKIHPNTEPTTQTPVEVYLAVNEALKAGDVSVVRGLSAPFIPKEMDETLKQLTPETAAPFKLALKNVSALDGKIFGDLAVIIKCDRDDRNPNNLDTDPIFLVRIDGQWKMLLAESYHLKPYLDERKLAKQFTDAMSWYAMNEQKVRQQLLNAKSAPSSK